MPELPQTTLHHHRDRAITILGLPTRHPFTHSDVDQAAAAKLASCQDAGGRAALELVCDLAHEYVNARGWRRHSLFPFFGPHADESSTADA